MNTYGSEGPAETTQNALGRAGRILDLPQAWRDARVRLGVPMRCSAPLVGPLGQLVDSLRDRLHADHADTLCERRAGELQPITRGHAHVELIHNKLATPFPGELTPAEVGARTAMASLAERCVPSHLVWYSGAGTGAGTTAILAVALTGVPHACRGLHITLAAARMASLTEERAADVLATAERHLRA